MKLNAYTAENKPEQGYARFRLTGYVLEEPVASYTNSGMMIMNFTVTVWPKVFGNNQAKPPQTFAVVAFGDTAEHIGERITEQDNLVHCEGTLRINTYQGQTTVQLLANDVFVSASRATEEGEEPSEGFHTTEPTQYGAAPVASTPQATPATTKWGQGGGQVTRA